jgi:DNA-binding transcriptional regulator YdaS (Cro superfamily)
MDTVALYLGTGAKQAPARRHHAIAEAVTAAILRASVLPGVPPTVSTLRGLP